MTVNGECSGCGWILDIRITPGQTTELLILTGQHKYRMEGRKENLYPDCMLTVSKHVSSLWKYIWKALL